MISVGRPWHAGLFGHPGLLDPAGVRQQADDRVVIRREVVAGPREVICQHGDAERRLADAVAGVDIGAALDVWRARQSARVPEVPKDEG